MEEQTHQPKGQSETVWITGQVNYAVQCRTVASDYPTKEKAGSRASQVSTTTLGHYMERQSAQWRHTKSDETTKNGPNHQGKKIEMAGTCVAHGRRQDTKSKPHDGKWTHAQEDRNWDRTRLTLYLEIWSQLTWHGKMQSKQQSTEKTGMDEWHNVSLTRAELRSKVRLHPLIFTSPLASHGVSKCLSDYAN